MVDVSCSEVEDNVCSKPEIKDCVKDLLPRWWLIPVKPNLKRDEEDK
jgi:hypothetical protein